MEMSMSSVQVVAEKEDEKILEHILCWADTDGKVGRTTKELLGAPCCLPREEACRDGDGRRRTSPLLAALMVEKQNKKIMRGGLRPVTDDAQTIFVPAQLRSGQFTSKY